jgi:phage gpG-like protein
VSVTFSIESNVKIVVEETARRVGIALDKVAIDWHAASVRAISDMVYNQPRGDYKRTNRLRSSITWSSPNVHAVKTYTHDEGTESYTPPKAGAMEALVGTNVEYAPAVHDGLAGGMVTVKAHQRRTPTGFTTVRSHQRLQAARQAKPFIEQPGIDISKKVPGMITEELNR